MTKKTLKSIKLMPASILLKLINKAKKKLKINDVWIDACKKYEVEPDIMDYIPVRFGNLDVSAKTIKGIIILNNRMLMEADVNKEIEQYLLHEATHHLQQCCGDSATSNSDDGDYLKNPNEQEAFQNQIEFIADEHGEDEAEQYVDDLLDHHDKEGKEKKKLEKVLLDKVE